VELLKVIARPHRALDRLEAPSRRERP
jgi:hypothetical protein